MADDGPWLNVPQAVVLEATRDIDLALDLTAESAALLLIKASWRVARRPVIPPEADADTRQPGDSHYLEAQRRVHGRLVEGVKTKARRTPRGPYESLDPVEYIGAELEGMDAIDKKTGTVILFDLLINLIDYVEHLTGQPIRPVGAASSRAPDQMQEQSSQDFQKWECTGDPVPKLIDWARSRWGEGSQALPNRFELLEVFRGQFGRVLGINEKTMREVRRRLASREARRGGAATHRR
jgi:hypothetical protein